MQLSAIIGALIFFTILLVISIGFSVRMNKINHNKTDLIRDAKVEDIEFILRIYWRFKKWLLSSRFV